MRFARGFEWLTAALRPSRGGEPGPRAAPDSMVFNWELPGLDRLREPPVEMTPGGVADALLVETASPPVGFSWWFPWISAGTSDAVARQVSVRVKGPAGVAVDIAHGIIGGAGALRLPTPRPIVLPGPGWTIQWVVPILTAGASITGLAHRWEIPVGERPPWM